VIDNVGAEDSSAIQYLRNKLSNNRVKVTVHETAGNGFNCEVTPHKTQPRMVSNADGQPEE